MVESASVRLPSHYSSVYHIINDAPSSVSEYLSLKGLDARGVPCHLVDLVICSPTGGCPINTPLNNKVDLAGNTNTCAAGNGYCVCDSLPIRRHEVGNEQNGSVERRRRRGRGNSRGDCDYFLCTRLVRMLARVSRVTQSCCSS